MDKPSTYTHFFGFSQKPFELEPDLGSLFLIKSQKEALLSVISGINERRGLILISGESGTGKTTLLHYLQARLPKKVKTVLISRASIFLKEILNQITQELGLPLADETPGFLLSQLHAHLTEGLGRGENLAVFVDEAQNLNKETFEELGRLAQMEEGGTKLVQIVLAGQPELETILGSEGFRSLNRQIRIHLRIQPLLPEESPLFIQQSLQRIGRSTAEVFTPEALDLIVCEGCGIFQNVLFLCDKAFQKGFDLQQKVIDAAIIRKIVAEMEVPSFEKREKPPEITSPDALLHRLFQDPPRIVKPGILAQAISHLKRRLLYVSILGTFVLGLSIYLGWELLLPPSCSGIPKIDVPAPVAKEPSPTPAPKEKAEPPSQNARIAPPDKKVESAPPPPAAEKVTPSPPAVKAGEKSAEKPAVKAPPRKPPKAEPRKESKAESKPEVKKGARYNQPVEVPKGKTLYSFARDYYHEANPTLIDYILEANPQIKDMKRIPTDIKIAIPEISEESLLAQSPDGSWKIRLGTFANLQAARRYKGEPLLKEKEVETVPRQVAPDTSWYQLYAGKFDKKEEALKAIQGLRKKGLLPALKK